MWRIEVDAKSRQSCLQEKVLLQGLKYSRCSFLEMRPRFLPTQHLHQTWKARAFLSLQNYVGMLLWW